MKSLFIVWIGVLAFGGIKEASAQKRELPPPEEIKIVQLSEIKPDDSIRDCWNINLKPEFPGGDSGFVNYVKARLPEAKIDKFVISFIIKRNGTPDEINILGYSSAKTKNKLTNIIKQCPKWRPGINQSAIYYPVMHIYINN